MKAEESRALIRWYILGAVGSLMAAGDWLLGCVPLQATDTGMFNHRRPLSKGQNGPVFVRHLYRGSGAGLPPGGLEYPAGGHPRPSQALQVPVATWMAVMSQSSTNSSIVLWCLATAVYTHKHPQTA